MPAGHSTHHKAAFGVQDALFVLFKHKWKILLLTLLGLAAAATMFRLQVPLYESQSKLLVRYVVERPSLDPVEMRAAPVITGGEQVINTEIEILTSVDLALDVAAKLGPAVLLPERGEAAQASEAAGRVLAHLKVGTGQSANVLHVNYGNPDPALSQRVLRQLIDCYFEKHLGIHRSAAAFDLVAAQTQEVRDKLRQTEMQLDELRSNSGIVSLADAASALSSQRARTQEELMRAKGELAELQAAYGITATAHDNENSATQGTPHSNPAKTTAPPAALSDYRTVTELLEFLRKRQLELGLKFKAGNRLLALNQQQIASYEAKRRKLLDEFPELALEAGQGDKPTQDPKWGQITAKARLAAVAAKIEVFESHLKEISNQFSLQYSVGSQIEELERRRQLLDSEYRSLETNLKNARLDQTLDPSNMPNITVLQQPSQPVKTLDPKMKKVMLGLAGSGLALGVGLAFVIELLFDRRVRRPIDIQARLQLPLLLSIPYIRKKQRRGLLLAGQPQPKRIGMGGELSDPRHHPDGLPPRRADHFILPFSEAIRDRIIFNFEINNITHKPKLVGITALSDGAGASTIAAGLAKSFAEVRGNKVLLVDLSSYRPEENPMFGELPRHSLNGALQLAHQGQFRDHPQNLYYASATARRDALEAGTFSPVHLYEMMPELMASQFDYIIFDMPPVHPTSRTLTMAGMMDKVLLVLDAENTDRDDLVWGYSELVKGKADVSCIFNKTRVEAPNWLGGRA